MSEHDDHFDDLASAFLDDEVTPVERDRLAADPVMIARAEELALVRDQLRRAPWPAVDEDRRERALAAALAAADEGVASLTATRASRRAARSRFAWLAPRPALAGAIAAAAVAVVGLAVWAGGREPSEPVANPATASAESAPAPPDEAARDQADTATVAAATADVAAPPVAGAGAEAGTTLGAFETPAELRAALAPALEAAATTLEDAACPAPQAGDRAVGTASYRGVLAVVFVRGEPPATAVVVDLDGCTVLDEVPLT